MMHGQENSTVCSVSQTLRCSRVTLRIPYPLLESHLPCNYWRFFIHTAPVLLPYIMRNICWISSTHFEDILEGLKKKQGKPFWHITHFPDRYFAQTFNADCHVKGAIWEFNPKIRFYNGQNIRNKSQISPNQLRGYTVHQQYPAL